MAALDEFLEACEAEHGEVSEKDVAALQSLEDRRRARDVEPTPLTASECVDT